MSIPVITFLPLISLQSPVNFTIEFCLNVVMHLPYWHFNFLPSQFGAVKTLIIF